MQLTQQEIQFIKDLYNEKKENEKASILNKQISDSLREISDKYQPLLDSALESGDLELRKQLIEQLSVEAKEKEDEIINSNS